MPAYKYFAKDNDLIMSDKNKFLKASEEIRMFAAIEECSVLAIERFCLPNNDFSKAKYAWMMALAKVSTSITSGFFRQYVFDNIFQIVKNYPEDFYLKFTKDLRNKNVKKY